MVYETIARESSNQPLEAQVLVARVIKVRSDERDLSPEEVCLQPKQFSCWDVKQKPRTKKDIETAKKAWNLAKTKHYDIKVNLYHDTSVIPYWTDKVKFVKQIGKLKFYYE